MEYAWDPHRDAFSAHRGFPQAKLTRGTKGVRKEYGIELEIGSCAVAIVFDGIPPIPHASSAQRSEGLAPNPTRDFGPAGPSLWASECKVPRLAVVHAKLEMSLKASPLQNLVESCDPTWVQTPSKENRSLDLRQAGGTMPPKNTAEPSCGQRRAVAVIYIFI